MGFPRERCVKAAYFTGNKSVEEASNWLFAHMEDPDIDQPLQLKSKEEPPQIQIDDESLGLIMSMGFSREKAIKALQATNNDIPRATEWIFSHMEEDMETESSAPTSTKNPNVKDGKGRKIKSTPFN